MRCGNLPPHGELSQSLCLGRGQGGGPVEVAEEKLSQRARSRQLDALMRLPAEPPVDRGKEDAGAAGERGT